eukprot:733594-Lingulodinium_polyedra.AAC.1
MGSNRSVRLSCFVPHAILPVRPPVRQSFSSRARRMCARLPDSFASRPGGGSPGRAGVSTCARVAQFALRAFV